MGVIGVIALLYLSKNKLNISVSSFLISPASYPSNPANKMLSLFPDKHIESEYGNTMGIGIEHPVICIQGFQISLVQSLIYSNL